MPPTSTSTTNTTLPDSLFAPDATTSSEPPFTSGADQDPALPTDEYPEDGPVQRELRQRLVQGKIPAGSQVRVERTRTISFDRPAEPFGPETVLPPDCEIYKLIRTITVEIRKYWVWAQNVEYLYSVETQRETRFGWVLICRNKDPVVILEKTKDEFSSTPTEMVDDQPYYWRPPDYVDILRHDHMTGWAGPPPAEELPATEPDYFYDIRLVWKLIYPVHYDGCFITARYQRAFHVVRTRVISTSPGGILHGPVDVYDVMLEGEKTETYRIPNCPRTPQSVMHLENPNRFAFGLTENKVRVAIAGGEKWSTAIATRADNSDLIRIWTITAELIDPQVPLKVRVAVALHALAAEVEARPDWRDFLTRRRPDFLLTELEGVVRSRDPEGVVVEVKRGRVLGTMGVGLALPAAADDTIG